MSVTWRGGDLHTLVARLEILPQKMAIDVREDLEAAVTLGGTTLQDLLEAAHTRTGERRAEGGGFPGRHDTGNMIASVGNDGDHPTIDGYLTTAAFGWFPEDYEQYFRDQDLGLDGIPPAHAMAGAFIRAREEFRARLTQRFGR